MSSPYEIAWIVVEETLFKLTNAFGLSDLKFVNVDKSVICLFTVPNIYIYIKMNWY